MTLYSLVLFVHVTATLALFAAIILEALALFHLRRATAVSEVRLWLDPLPGLPLMATGSLLVVLVSGIYLAIRVSAFGAGWPAASMAGMVLLAPFAILAARRMREIRKATAAATGIHSDLQRRLQDPFLKAASAIRMAVMLGIVFLMAVKPSWGASAVVLSASSVLGLSTGFLRVKAVRDFSHRS